MKKEDFMINKQSLWFVTLFSLIIILSIYYFSSDQTTLSIAKVKNSESIVAFPLRNIATNLYNNLGHKNILLHFSLEVFQIIF